MNYKENFENLSWDEKSSYKPISNFSYSVMKTIGSVIGFIYRTNKTLENIHKEIEKEFVHPCIKYFSNAYNANHIYNKYSKLYLNIKTYWNMMGSIMLPIRNYVQNVNEIYTIFQKYLDINVLDEIEFTNLNRKYKELSDFSRIEYSNGYETFVESLGFILNSIQQVQILSSIKEEKISDINWSFKEFMNVTLNRINTLDIDGEDKVISFFNMIEKILEYLKFDSEEEKTNSMDILLNCEIQRFVVALINVLIYKSYEKMTELFMNEISYFNDVIKGKNDYNGEMLSTYEIKQIEEK